MQVVTIEAQDSARGELRLDLPAEMAGQNVMVTIQAARATGRWPAEFFEKFSGCLPDFPDIEPEGGDEKQDPL